MPDENKQEDKQQNNNGGSGHTYILGMDTNAASDQNSINTIKKTLEDCGNTVHISSVYSNQEGEMPPLAKKYNADACIFACALAPATIWSFRDAVKAGTLPHTIFAIEGWISKYKTMDAIREAKWEPEHDAGQFMSSSSNEKMMSEASTVGEWLDANSEYITVCVGKKPEELAENICNGQCGGGTGGSSTTTSAGSGAQIKDKTFEHCIKRICAATDSVFLVENNAAVLFPYTDWMAFTLRHQINQVRAKDMDPDLFEIDYNTDGFYNKVTVVWGADEQQDKVTSDKENEEDKKTIGNTTTIQKTMPTGGTQMSEQYDPLVNIYGELEKKVVTNFKNEETAHYVMNALLIQYIRDFNNSCRVRTIHNNKYVGGTFYAVENPNTKKSELFYLNSYTIFKEKNQPLVTDLEFKYGPEGAEELLDYQTLSGGSGGGTTTNTGISATEDQIWKDAAKIKYAHANSTQDPEEAWKMFGGKEDKSSTDCYGMSSYLYYRFNNQANIPCRVVGDSSHHVVMIYKNNSWKETRDEYKNYNFDYLFKWKTEQNTTTLLEAKNPPSGSSSNANPSGNTANQNEAQDS